MLNLDARQQLQTLLPLGMVATKPWLQAQGLSLHFLDNAVRSQTLIPLTAGVYSRQEARISWKGIVASLQRMAVEPVHVGGLSALAIEGLSHYLSNGVMPQVHLYLSIDQILIPCAIKSLAARKPSSLLCRASQPSQRAPQLAIPVRLLSIKPPSLAIAM